MKKAAIYKGKDGYIVHSYSLTKDGFNIAQEPYFHIDFSATKSDLFTSIINALNASEKNTNTPNNWSEFNKNYLNMLKVKSQSQMNKLYQYCEIEMIDDYIKFTPSYKDLKNGGYNHLPSRAIEVPRDSNPDIITQTLDLIFIDSMRNE